MKKSAFFVLVLGASLSFISCSKKQAALEELQEPVSIETISMLNTQAPVDSEAKAALLAQPASSGVSAPVNTRAKAEVALPAVSAQPTTKDIQTALKNAGFYLGNIDGKNGSLTKKGIREFQKAKGLSVDGKVGPKTWSLLSAYLNSTSAVASAEKK
jgi:peptidoglycan hydrolase-like protein with peptidoglycan-binding domain